METKPAHFHWFIHGGSRRRSSLTPAMMCAAAFMLSSFVLSFFSLGGVGENISFAGVTDAANSHQLLHFPSPILLAICGHLVSLQLDQLRRLHQIPAPHPSLAWCLLLRWKLLSSNVMLPNVSCMTPFRQFIIALEVAKNGLPRIIGT